MLFKKKTLAGIRSGEVTLAFRRWRRPTVREGGSQLTPVGELAIAAVRPVELDAISEADARAAGHGSREELVAELTRREGGDVYRIDLGPLSPDPRIALRATPAEGEERVALAAKLERLDARAAGGPWTRRVLELIAERPGVRAGDLCLQLGQEKVPFKRNVRKLKTLGLTESLDVGYRLSPRGAATLDDLRAGSADA